MKIWHQSFTDLSRMPLYRRTLEEHAANIMEGRGTVAIHGLRPGTYGDEFAPIDAIKYRYLESLNEDQLCEAALAAEREGFDAMAIGCFFDPALRAARSLVDIPVVSLAETCMLVACSYGRKFAVITLCGDEAANLADLCEQYGVERRLAGIVPMEPSIDEYTLEAEGDAVAAVSEGFARACVRAFDLGAEVVIPGDGVLNEFLYRQGTTGVGGATVMDSIGVLFTYAEMLFNLRASAGMTVSRRQMYLRPPEAMLQFGREFARRTALTEADFSGSAAPTHKGASPAR
jgi:Asp/Glu/hydantoin racemase